MVKKKQPLLETTEDFVNLKRQLNDLTPAFQDHKRSPHPPAPVKQLRPFRGTEYVVQAVVTVDEKGKKHTTPESLAIIAKDLLGNSGRLKEIVSLNNLVNPNAIFVGQVLKIPPK